MLPIRTILHPTDFSEGSDVAFHLASSLARDYGARLIVLHVAEPPMPIYVGGPVVVPPIVNFENLKARLEHLTPCDPTVHAEYILKEGNAAWEILRIAAETKTDVIVMGTHGRTGVIRMLMGSVAELVLRKAPCPVVTVKCPMAKAKAASNRREEKQPMETVSA